ATTPRTPLQVVVARRDGAAQHAPRGGVFAPLAPPYLRHLQRWRRSGRGLSLEPCVGAILVQAFGPAAGLTLRHALVADLESPATVERPALDAGDALGSNADLGRDRLGLRAGRLALAGLHLDDGCPGVGQLVNLDAGAFLAIFVLVLHLFECFVLDPDFE